MQHTPHTLRRRIWNETEYEHFEMGEKIQCSIGTDLWYDTLNTLNQVMSSEVDAFELVINSEQNKY